MAKRMITLMAALLVLGFVVTGCGDDESSNDSGDTAAQTVTDTDTVTDDEVVTDTETVTDETDTDVTSDDNGGAVAPENVEQAVASCKKAVTSSPGLSEDTKSDLEGLCDKAASGNAEDAREASLEVCKKIVEDLYPSGVPGKDQALSACEQSVQQ